MAKVIALTKGYSAVVDDEDYARVNAFSWHAKLDKNKRKVYARTIVKTDTGQKTIYMHRFILNAPPDMKVDHVRSDATLINTRDNLRLATDMQNAHNSKIRKDNTSGFKGVGWSARKNRWVARIVISGKRIHLGYFSDKIDAALAYNRAAADYFGEFAVLNFHLDLPKAA